MVTVELKADVLRKAAAERNLSLAELAKTMGIAPTYLSVILRGKRRISPKVRRRMLDRLGLKFEEVFSLVHRS
jgi:transcriptional regulator with XRE-family HTH domain